MKTILFDLDGTIMDSGEGIMESAQYALNHFGFEKESLENLRRFVGPSLMYSFTTFYGLSEEDASRAVGLYREVYNGGNLFHAKVYDGMEEVLSKLKERGHQLIVVTSKPENFVVRILAKFHLDCYFEGVISPDLMDPSSDKARLIRRAMDKFHFQKVDAVMIGDTKYDMLGAAETGLKSIGVTYGYGSLSELMDAGACHLCEKPSEIFDLLSAREE